MIDSPQNLIMLGFSINLFGMLLSWGIGIVVKIVAFADRKVAVTWGDV